MWLLKNSSYPGKWEWSAHGSRSTAWQYNSIENKNISKRIMKSFLFWPSLKEQKLPKYEFSFKTKTGLSQVLFFLFIASHSQILILWWMYFSQNTGYRNEWIIWIPCLLLSEKRFFFFMMASLKMWTLKSSWDKKCKKKGVLDRTRIQILYFIPVSWS